MTRVIIALIVLALTGGSALAATDPGAATILAKAKAASGGSAWDEVKLVRTKFHLAASGLTGTGETLEDAGSGRFVTSYDLGVTKGASGYDGASAWSQDQSGQVNIEENEDARRDAVNNAYRAMYAFWFTARMAADISKPVAKTEGKRKFDVIKIAPQGGRPFDLWIDHTTHLIDRTVEQGATETETISFSNYKTVDGKQIAFASRQSTGNVKYDTLITVDSVTFEAQAPDNAFAPPPPPKPDFGFVKNVTRTTVPMRLVNNHTYVKLTLNGKGPYEFIFDTGGQNVMTPTLAAELGLKPQGALEGGGVGESKQDVGIAKVDRMRIGDAYLDNQSFAVIGLESLGNVEGVPMVGIFGYDVFKRFVVRTDYDHKKITLTAPEGYRYAGNGVRVPFKFEDGAPSVEGTIDGIPGAFRLDTGSRTSLDLSSPFVAKNNLVKKYDAKIQGVTGWGVGGGARSWIVRAHELSFGGLTVKDPVVGLSQQEKGSFADIYIIGNIGAGVLKRFDIVWNYPKQEIYFEKNAGFDAPDVFDRAGMWVNLGANGFDVMDVYAGAPAYEAGIRAGDHILKVDGHRAGGELSLVDFRSMTRKAPGKKIKVEVERGGETRKLVITLRDLV